MSDKLDHEIQYNEKNAIVAYPTVVNNGNIEITGQPVVEEVDECAIYCLDCNAWLDETTLPEHGIRPDWDLL